MTIRARLALIYGIAMMLTLGLVGVLLWWQFAAALRASLDQALEVRASSVLSAAENGQVGLRETNTGMQTVFVALFDAQGRLVDATASAPRGLTPPAAANATSELTVGPDRYALYTAVGNDGVRAVAGSSLATITDTLDRLARSVIVVAVAASLASLLGGWWLAGRALRPVAAITQEAAEIGADDLDRRLPVPRQRDELHRLATTLNGMLERVAESVRRQRLFVATASHDLRTPIAALQVELELASDPRTTVPELRAALAAAHADAVRLGELATALLDLAASDSDGRALVRTPVPIDELLDAVVRRLGPLARERETRLVSGASSGEARVDRLRIEQALTNVVANAIAYGPPGSEVQIRAALATEAAVADELGVGGMDHDAQRDRDASNPVLTIEVLDQGPGIPAGLARSLFEPFLRGPNATGNGAGLGLATAAAAVRAHGGSIGYEPRPVGGTRFWMRLPA